MGCGVVHCSNILVWRDISSQLSATASEWFADEAIDGFLLCVVSTAQVCFLCICYLDEVPSSALDIRFIGINSEGVAIELVSSLVHLKP